LIAQKFAIAAEAQGLGVMLEAAPNLPPVQADADRLAQVLQNLLANALRHTPAGNITLAATADGVTGRVCISVTDSGEGIPPEDLPHVFDRFFRGDGLRARARSGSGLGLAIARSWVIAMNGQIGVESIQGQGSRFWFTLNIAGGGRSGPVQS
jgi:signal transduction histidine kinase